MQINHKKIKSEGIRISAEDKSKEIGRAFLYILKNDLRNQPLGYLEDLFVDENYRKQGIGTKLIEEVIRLAKTHNCYKIVATSRYESENVHRLYKKIGFEDFGKEFKMYLPPQINKSTTNTQI
jgi:GNAT superfamily N-acetyltransferase